MRLWVAVVLSALLQLTACRRLLVFYIDSLPGSQVYRYSRLSAFAQLEREGVWCDHLYGVYPTQSIPSQWSLLTGCLPSHHGIVADYFYSRSMRQYFEAGHRSSDYDERWWGQREPIYSIARKQGVKVAAFSWPFLCNISNAIDTCVPPSAANVSRDNIDKILSTSASHDLTLVYYDDILRAAERDGVETVLERNLQQGQDAPIPRLNAVLQTVLNHVRQTSDLNVIVLSGHGMHKALPEHQVFLEDYLDMSLINTTVGFGALKHLLPINGRTGAIIEQLSDRERSMPHVMLQRTDPRVASPQLRDVYKYHASDEIPELILEAQIGYNIRTKVPGKQVPSPSPADSRLALSGYNNQYPHMLGLFYAIGPVFVSDYRVPRVDLVDVFAVMCDVLQIDCQRQPTDTTTELQHISTLMHSTQRQQTAGAGHTCGCHALTVLTLYYLVLGGRR